MLVYVTGVLFNIYSVMFFKKLLYDETHVKRKLTSVNLNNKYN